MTRRRVVFAVVLLALLVVGLVKGTPAFAAGPPVVYVENDSASVPQADVVAALPAFQLAVSRDLAASWGTDAFLTADPAFAASAAMVVKISDDATCMGCLGYHDVSAGRPTSYVFAATSAAYNEAWPLVAMHEIDEMLVDPWVNRFSVWSSRLWLVEVGDPCESGLYAYWIDGVPISDFITPAWYGGVRGKRVDFTGGLKRPGQIGAHGYASWRRSDGSWGQTFGFHAKGARRAR